MSFTMCGLRLLIRSVFTGIRATILCSVCCTAAPKEGWQSFRFDVMDVSLGVSVPTNLIWDIQKPIWRIRTRSVHLEGLLSGRYPQTEIFNACLDIKGPFWIGGHYGGVVFSALVGKKPGWHQGDLQNIHALREMMQHRVWDYGRAMKYHFEIVSLGNLQWVHWFSGDIGQRNSPVRVAREDCYTRALTDDLYLDVRLDIQKWAVTERDDWIPKANALRDRLKNNLTLEYPKNASQDLPQRATTSTDARFPETMTPEMATTLARAMPDGIAGTFEMRVRATNSQIGDSKSDRAILRSHNDDQDPACLFVEISPDATISLQDQRGIDPFRDFGGQVVRVRGIARSKTYSVRPLLTPGTDHTAIQRQQTIVEVISTEQITIVSNP